MTNPQLQTLVEDVLHSFQPEARRPQEVFAIIDSATDEELAWLLRQWRKSDDLAERFEAAATRDLLEKVLHSLAARQAQRRLRGELGGGIDVDSIVNLYRHLGELAAARCRLLSILASQAGRHDLRAFAELIVADPPREPNAVAMAFSPLFQSKDYDPTPLFPRLFDGFQWATVAVFTLDLANFLTRHRRLANHPAKSRVAELHALLMALTAELARLEVLPDDRGQSAQETSAQVEECISLAVALCDALALIGDASSVGKLRPVMELSHRRLRTEAAAALAALGDEEGKRTMLAMASEPVVRLRVIKYAEELGIVDEIDGRYRQADSLAAAELALFLAQPAQVGIPPSECELVDRRELYWPGYDDLIECFLLRYSYHLGDRQFSNIGIVGPVTHAIAADLQDLPVSDIYACFAGWQAEHEEIYEVDVNQLTEAQRVDVSRLERRIHDQGYQQIQPVKFGRFFGEKVLVARASKEGAAGVVVADVQEVLWFSAAASSRPLGTTEAYNIFKGKRLLRSFND